MKDFKCPITGANVPKLLLSIIAGYAFVFAFDMALHVGLLMDTYLTTPQLWRTEADMEQVRWWGTLMAVLKVVITAFIFTRNFEGKGLCEGLRFGAMIGALLGVEMAASYAWMPISMDLALAWLAGGFVQGLGLGVIYSFTYRPCGWCDTQKKEGVCGTGTCSKDAAKS